MDERLATYVRNALSNGYTEQQVLSMLMSRGYLGAVAREAIAAARQPRVLHPSTLRHGLMGVPHNQTKPDPAGEPQISVDDVAHRWPIFVLVGVVILCGIAAAIIWGPEDCGNGILDEGENALTCCADAGCLGDRVCTKGGCVDPECTGCTYLFNGSCVRHECCEDTHCEDADPSTQDRCVQNACENEPIVACVSGDGYCPPGCDGADPECSATI